jgi:hypothetical protein
MPLPVASRCSLDVHQVYVDYSGKLASLLRNIDVYDSGTAGTRNCGTALRHHEKRNQFADVTKSDVDRDV